MFTFAEAFAFWPVWAVFVAFVWMPLERNGHYLGLAVVLGLVATLGGLALHAERQAGLVEIAERNTTAWVAATAILVVVLGCVEPSFELPTPLLILMGACAAAIVSTALFGYASMVRRWPTGTLRVCGCDVRLECDDVVYRLSAPPSFAMDGDPLTLPVLHHERRHSGPYRSSSGIAYAPIVLRIEGAELARRLRIRGVCLGLWSLFSVLFALR